MLNKQKVMEWQWSDETEQFLSLLSFPHTFPYNGIQKNGLEP